MVESRILRSFPSEFDISNSRDSSLWPSGRLISLVLAVASIAAVAGIVFRLLLDGASQFAWPIALRTLGVNLLYAYFISVPAAAGLRLLSLRRQSSGMAGLIPWATLTLAAACFFGCMAAGLAIVALRLAPLASFWQDLRSSLTLSLALTFSFGLSTWIYETMRKRLEQSHEELRARQMEEERARTLLAEARLAAIEARVQPHFVFNALNSVAAMIPRDPNRAEKMVLQVSALLRFSLQAHQTTVVELRRELDIVGAYLELQKARFGDRLRFAVKEPQGCGHGDAVPPMSVQTLVENAVKYAVDPFPEGGYIQVSAVRAGGTLSIRVEDSGPGFSLEALPKGHGLDNLIARLELIYGGKGRAGLSVARSESGCCVELSIPAPEEP